VHNLFLVYLSNKKGRYSDICKKQQNGLAVSRDADGRKKEYPKEYWSGNQWVGETEEDQGKRWIEDTEEDIQIMGIRGWRNLCKERAEWKRITENAKKQWVVTPVKEEEEVYLSITTCFGRLCAHHQEKQLCMRHLELIILYG
jgi:hypothetical protein